MKSVFIIDGNYQYDKLFTDIGFEIAKDVAEADLMCFTGGEDVSPYLYGQPLHSTTYCNTTRDKYEVKCFEYTQEYGIPCVGICRGGQFLNVMNGGTMYQDVTRHCGDHHMIVDGGREILVSSTHHQMMNPGLNAHCVAYALQEGKRTYWDEDEFVTEVSSKDYEVLYYPYTKSLCFQPHPEFPGDRYQGMKDFFKECLTKYLDL